MLMIKRVTTFVLVLTSYLCVLPSLLCLCIERLNWGKYKILEENKRESKQIFNVDDVSCTCSKWIVI